MWVGQNHGSALDDMASPTSCTLNSPEAVEAVEFFAGMMDNDLAMRNAALSQAGGDAAVFTSGQVAMIIQNASRIPTFNAADMNYDVAVVPIPEGGQRSASAAGAAWTMSSFSDDKDAAWTFLSWLALNPEGGQRLYTESAKFYRHYALQPIQMPSLGKKVHPKIVWRSSLKVTMPKSGVLVCSHNGMKSMAHLSVPNCN
ncbi:MAG: extracellular solute-binding protein [Anaerolineae bacterium]|nr:extracellular solute-binding protein [Anaerolineae bacterium]